MESFGTHAESVPGSLPSDQTQLAAVVFTDVVHSTALKNELGDRAGAALIERHHALVREVLAGFPDGEEIETAGDSFLLVFTKPSSSVRFALTLQARLSAWNREQAKPVTDRVGIHSGEIVMRPSNERGRTKRLAGLQVDLAARVMSLAQGGQILLTRAVFDSARQVLKGEDIPGLSSLSWINHGPFVFKGIEDPVEICEVVESAVQTLPPPPTSEKAHRQAMPDREAVLGWRPGVGQAVPETGWVLECPLGEGGFGEVWVGRHRVMRERRVFKFCFEADRVRSLKREMMLFRLIKERIGDHPNIVGLREVYFEKAPYFLEMDYVPGHDLRKWSELLGGLGAIPIATKLEVIAQAADGLQAAHDAGVIHRDVKPGNILVGDAAATRRTSGTDGAVEPTVVPTVRTLDAAGDAVGAPPPLVKLTDFGIGQVISEEYLNGVTQAGFTKTMLSSSSAGSGTQLYLAPELLAGKPGSIRSDIYSLGVVFYQLIVGDFTQPVTAEWSEEIADPLLREDLKHCLAGKPEDRFAGAGQLACSLRAWEQRKRELAEQRAEEAERERLRAQVKRRHQLLLACGAVVLVMVALAAALGFGMRKAQRERAQQRMIAYAADMRAADAAIQEGNLGQATHLLERYLAAEEGEDLRGIEWRYLWELARSDDAGGIRYPALPFCGDVSPDGNWIITGAMDGWVRIHDMQGKEVLRHHAGYNKKIVFWPGVAFAPKGNRVAAATKTNVVVWETRDWRVERVLDHAKVLVSFSPDGQRMLALGFDGLHVWSTSTWKPEFTPENASFSGRLYHATFTPDNSGLVLGLDAPPRIAFWSLADRKTVETNIKIESLMRLAISPDGHWVATSCPSGRIFVWDVTGQTAAVELPCRVPYTVGLVFSPDSKVLATAGADQLIHLWQAGTTNQVGQLKGHRGEIWWLNYTTDGQWLISGSEDGTVRRWAASGEATRSPAYQLPEGRTVFAVSSGGSSAHTWDGANQASEEWDLKRTNLLQRTKLEPQRAPPIETSLHEHLLIAGSAQNSAVVLDTRTGKQVFPPASETNRFLIAAVSSSAGLVSSTERTDSGWAGGVWDLARGKKRIVLSDQENDHYLTGNAAFSPDNTLLAYESIANEIHLLRLPDGKVRRLPGHSRPLFCLRFSPDGRLLASSSWDATARVWDVASGRPVTPWLVGHRSGISSLSFSPDGRTLATGNDNDQVTRFWHVATGTEILGPRRKDHALSTPFALDGTALIVGAPGTNSGVVLVTTLQSSAEIDARTRTQSLVNLEPVGR